jgi:hypothetical protein
MAFKDVKASYTLFSIYAWSPSGLFPAAIPPENCTHLSSLTYMHKTLPLHFPTADVSNNIL